MSELPLTAPSAGGDSSCYSPAGRAAPRPTAPAPAPSTPGGAPAQPGMRWLYTPCAAETVEALSRRAGVSPVLAELLFRRGFIEPEVATTQHLVFLGNEAISGIEKP